MTVEERVTAFHNLGHHLRNLDETNRHSLLNEPRQFNAWFTSEQVNLAIANVSRQLERDKLRAWLATYELKPSGSADVGVVMAGNIPLVGFHDLMAVLLSGHKLIAKPSSQDDFLIRYMIDQLVALEPRFRDQIELRDKLTEVDAVIATGSDNTARYFEYYFRSMPHLIRKNRSSCAILTGKESAKDLEALGQDIFSFYGLGCRNVSKLFIPTDYEITQVFKHWTGFESIVNHHKYANNYDYNKSILLVNVSPFLDNGFMLVRESTDLVSPISVLYYERYRDQANLKERIESSGAKIQCIVGLPDTEFATVTFGNAQFPELNDYADGVDTMEFLTRLGR